MTVGDLVEVKLETSLRGQLCLNIFHYRLLDAAASAALLPGRWSVEVVPKMQAISSAELEFDKIVARNVFDPLDFAELGLVATAGSVAIEYTSAYQCMSFQYPRQRTDMRHGWKRFSGVPETRIQNDAIEGGPNAAEIAMALQLETPITDGGGGPTDWYSPVIVKRIPDGVDSKGRQKYRLPIVIGEFIYYVATSVIAKHIGSQLSRKRLV